MIFSVILEENNKLIFITLDDCKHIDDAINYIHAEHPESTIEQIKEIK